jgi:hypothetical protein
MVEHLPCRRNWVWLSALHKQTNQFLKIKIFREKENYVGQKLMYKERRTMEGLISKDKMNPFYSQYI